MTLNYFSLLKLAWYISQRQPFRPPTLEEVMLLESGPPQDLQHLVENAGTGATTPAGVDWAAIQQLQATESDHLLCMLADQQWAAIDQVLVWQAAVNLHLWEHLTQTLAAQQKKTKTPARLHPYDSHRSHYKGTKDDERG